MAERKLDKTRDYGTVLGDPKIGYEQDGAHFSHDGAFINTWATAEQLAHERVQAQERLAKEQRAAVHRDLLAQRRRLLEQA